MTRMRVPAGGEGLVCTSVSTPIKNKDSRGSATHKIILVGVELYLQN